MSARLRSTRPHFGRLFAVLLLLPITVSCIFGGGEKVPELYPDAIIELQKGISQLEAGEYHAARNTLLPLLDDSKDLGIALNYDPLAKDQARYTYVLANSMNQINEWVTTGGNILQIALSFGGSPGVTANKLRTLGGSGVLAGTLDSFIDGFIDFFEANSKILQQIKETRYADGEAFSIVYSSLPVKFDIVNVEVMNLRGEHDLAEVMFMDSVFLIATAVMKLVIAMDFSFKFTGDSLPYVLDQAVRFFDEENPPALSIFSNILAVVFHTQTRLLDLADATTMKEAGVAFAGTFSNLRRAIEHVIADSVNDPDQSDDLVGHIVENDTDWLELHIDFKSAVVVSLDELDNIRFRVDDNLLSAIDSMERSFAGEAGQRISWFSDIAPVISVLVTALVRSGFVITVAESVIATFGGDPSSLEQARGFLETDLISEDLINGVLVGAIPDVLEFDVGYYFSDPRGAIRDWIPFWSLPYKEDVSSTNKAGQVVTGPVDVYDDMRLFISYECDDDFAGGDDNPTNPPILSDGTEWIVCSGDDALEVLSIDHFTPEYFPQVTTQEFKNVHNKTFLVAGREIAMWQNLQEMRDFSISGNEAGGIVDFMPPTDADPVSQPTGAEDYGLLDDGVDSELGLIAFRDPTVSGMLYIRVDTPTEQTNVYASTTFFPATNRSLNALIQSLYQNIIGLVGGL